ncbi:MAG: nucleoside-diphosphate sugar epimerase [Ferruginibacter sp.]|nr:nucleoside-diphosphate sugar epimerase [Ferruginibacter sp.]
MKIFNIEKFIAENISNRNSSLFAQDIADNNEQLSAKIKGKSVMVIGGAGSIGSSFIKAVMRFSPAEVYVIDINENGLTELVRDVRSDNTLSVPATFITYPIDFSDAVFKKIFQQHGRFDIVANFAAHKHVRSEKDHLSIEAMVENNVFKARDLLDLMLEYRPDHFFCVSTDKAANPVNVMGASKKLMEHVVLAYSKELHVSTARFANVAFSNGSLLFGFMERLLKRQPLSAPNDVKRYFVSPSESGELCMLACMLADAGNIFFPKLPETSMLTFSAIADRFLAEHGLTAVECKTETEAKAMAAALKDDTTEYPVYYFSSDTSGEKSFEEFYTDTEDIDLERFNSLGIVRNNTVKSIAEITEIIDNLKKLFDDPATNKATIVESIGRIIPNFTHIETGLSLDQKI